MDELRAQQTTMRTQQHDFFSRMERLLGEDRVDGNNRNDGRGRPGFQPQQDDSDDDDTISVDNPFAPPNRNDAPRGDPNRWESSFRFDVPEFDGGSDADEVIDWLHFVEEILNFKSVPDNRRVPLVATWLRGCASAWWSHTKMDRQRQRKPPLLAWSKFRKHFE